MNFIDLSKQYESIKDRINSRVQRVFDHGNFIMGPEVFELEEKLSSYVGVKHCISCANGTDALELALICLDIGKNDAVFCPTFTFFATAEVIASAKATPVFVDSNKDTFNICPLDLEKKIQYVLSHTSMKPKAIIAVDLFGHPADYPKLQIIADKYKLKIIEDAAQGFGGQINNKMACSFGDIATTSFFPAKPLGCYGDGGAIFTNNDRYSELLNSLKVHGKGSDKYDNVRIGMNSRLDTIQAAILLEKLEIFPSELIARNEIAQIYNLKYENYYHTPKVSEGFYSSWAQYTVRSPFRDKEMLDLQSQGIPTMIYYKKCMHQQPAFSYLGYREGDFPIAENLAKTVFSLPMHPYLQL